jgi:hypothetical protein
VIVALALIGLLISVVVHVLTYFGHGGVPGIWLLHVGVFVVWFPTVLKLKAAGEGKGRFWFLDVLPWWQLLIFAIAAPIVFAGALASMARGEGVTHEENGSYSIVNHGQTVRELSEAEYRREKARELRGFSGIWVIFYGVAAAVSHSVPPPETPS